MLNNDDVDDAGDNCATQNSQFREDAVKGGTGAAGDRVDDPLIPAGPGERALHGLVLPEPLWSRR